MCCLSQLSIEHCLLADDGQEEDIFAQFTVTKDDDEHQSPVATKKLAKPATSAGERISSQVEHH